MVCRGKSHHTFQSKRMIAEKGRGRLSKSHSTEQAEVSAGACVCVSGECGGGCSASAGQLLGVAEVHDRIRPETTPTSLFYKWSLGDKEQSRPGAMLLLSQCWVWASYGFSCAWKGQDVVGKGGGRGDK